MKKQLRTISLSTVLLTLSALAGAQQADESRTPTIVVTNPVFNPFPLYLVGGIVLLAAIGLVVWLMSRRGRGNVVASSGKK